MNVPQLLALIRQEERPSVLGQIVKQADLMRMAAKAVQLGIEVQNNAAVVAMEARARVGELYAGLEDGAGKRTDITSLPAGNEVETPKQEFTSEVGFSRKEISKYVQLAKAGTDAERRDLYLDAVDSDTGEITWKGVYRAVRTWLHMAPGGMGVHFSSDTPEHYTPAEIIDAAIACMGGIDLDPCSNSHETPNVPAATHYTRDDNGLAQVWRGCVYMNPPYGYEIDDWVSKLVDQYENGEVTEAIALVPARTDTQWWQRLRDYHVCFVTGRLTFIGNQDSAPFPSAVVYLGDSVETFVNAFEGIGDIWHRTRHGYCFGE